MLQRIQSIYLLLAGLSLFSLFLFPLVHNVYVNDKPVTIMVTGVFQDANGHQEHTEFFVALSVATAIIAFMPLALIFLFKNRKQQVTVCYITILLIIGYSFWMSQTAKKVMGDVLIDTHNWGIGLLLSTVSILFIIFAIKAIQRDEKLVKSADRLR